MLTFLNQTMLFALAGIGIPILIHFFARRKNSKVIFSSLFFLKAIQNQSIRRLQIRQWILLLLRCLAIIMLVLAFARPVWRKPLSFYPGRGKSTAVLVVDRSMSMNRNDLFETAVRQSLVTVETATGNEIGLVWIPDDSSRDIKPADSANMIQKILKQTSASWMSGSVHSSVDRAITLFDPSESINQEIYLVSDMQYSGFRQMAEDSLRPGAKWQGRIFVWPVTENVKTQNVGVVDGGISQLIVQPNMPVQLSAHIKNYGSRHADVLVRAIWDGEAVEQKEVSLEAGQMKHVPFQVVPRKGGWRSGSIDIEDDGFNQDNRWFFSCWVPDKIRILILTGKQTDQRPLQLIFEQNSGEGKFFEIRKCVFGEPWPDLLDTDVLLISDYPYFKTLEIERITQFLKDGGGVFYAPGESTDIKNLNTLLGFSKNIAFGSIVGEDESGSGYLLMGRTDFEHPLFQGVFKEGKEKIQSPKFFRYYKVQGNPDPIISLENGDFLAGCLSVGKGKLLIMSSGLDLPFSDIIYSSFFGPFVFRGAIYLEMARFQERKSQKIGQPLVMQTPIRNISSGFYLFTPENNAITLYPRINKEEAVFTFRYPQIPGIYRLYQNDRLLSMSAVNIDPSESDFSVISHKEFSAEYPKAQVRFAHDSESLKTSVSSSRLGRELTHLFFLAAFLILATEMLIGRTQKKAIEQKRG